jgi:hypothetical protein
MAMTHGEDASLPRWPARDPERYVTLRALLAVGPARPTELSRRFHGANAARCERCWRPWAALGQARRGEDGRHFR